MDSKILPKQQQKPTNENDVDLTVSITVRKWSYCGSLAGGWAWLGIVYSQMAPLQLPFTSSMVTTATGVMGI